MDPLETPINELPWVNASFGRGLARLGIETWRDLVEHYPRRHEDRSRFGRFPTASSETPTCIRGVITKITGRYFARRKIVEATGRRPQTIVADLDTLEGRDRIVAACPEPVPPSVKGVRTTTG